MGSGSGEEGTSVWFWLGESWGGGERELGVEKSWCGEGWEDGDVVEWEEGGGDDEGEGVSVR